MFSNSANNFLLKTVGFYYFISRTIYFFYIQCVVRNLKKDIVPRPLQVKWLFPSINTKYSLPFLFQCKCQMTEQLTIYNNMVELTSFEMSREQTFYIIIGINDNWWYFISTVALCPKLCKLFKITKTIILPKSGVSLVRQLVLYKSTFQKTEAAIKNGQSRDPDNIRLTRHMTMPNIT